MQDVVAADRTAIGVFQDSLADFSAVELGSAVIRTLLDKTGLATTYVDEVILCQVLIEGCGQNPARRAAITAGLPYVVPAHEQAVRVGSETVAMAAQTIRCRDGNHGCWPVPASRKYLEKAGWALADLDLIEANETFAAQALSVGGEQGWDIDKVNGGAIALDHPIDPSGCQVLVPLLYEMIRRDARKGLVTLCIGGGQGLALTLHRD
ncbi:hypothetical protein M8R19_25850 [Pseudomonas sp. R3.Fl]|jgi:acetyl-CoA acetyltransferase|uniref:thiolase family protein n=1 Tax=Pseudomonas TaxID=286 RepID=UPI0007306F46|nr:MULTISPECIES: hypothetical protein [Pseudomonas]KSW22926.1 hypothetical protein AOX63_05825 [Pseudomonas sp. ADP]AMO77682.1 Acetyl-CoA acetyltransferase [Pseudomonas citronellolis]MCL6692119.1 hypothetical protein [Pseudomonas sp. R3.Fl]MDN6875736.1 hypothetical protein [Pseudomonas citronellolis]OBP09164.1 hypothetical protein BAE52_20985 [Pseudomonas sp. EGD-AKN5]